MPRLSVRIDLDPVPGVSSVYITVPAAVPLGSKKLTCVGETKKSWAVRAVPALSRTLTVVPASVVGKGDVVAVCRLVANPVPKAAVMMSADKAVALKLAAETLASVLIVVPGFSGSRNASV